MMISFGTILSLMLFCLVMSWMVRFMFPMFILIYLTILLLFIVFIGYLKYVRKASNESKRRNKKEVECDHDFISTSNNWFHWNTGILMTRGRCLKCGLEKEIRFSKVKK